MSLGTWKLGPLCYVSPFSTIQSMLAFTQDAKSTREWYEVKMQLTNGRLLQTNVYATVYGHT